MSIKLLQITAAYKPAYIYGGPTMSVSMLCEALAACDDVDVNVLTTTANGKQELPVIANETTTVDGVTVTYFKRLTKDHTHFSPALLLNLRKEILLHPKMIIHIHAWWNLVSIFSCSLAKWYNIPVILSPRGMLTNYTANNRNSVVKSIIHTTLGKRLLTYCHIHATSEKEKQDVLAIVKPKSITVIPNLVKLPFAPQHAEKSETQLSSEEHFKLIFLSRIEEKKGLEILFESLTDLPFSWHLTIAGTGEEGYVNRLKAKAKSLTLEKMISWIGQVKNEDKFKLMANHHLLVLTSYNENFANVIIESLSVGTPVMLSNQVGLASYVQENNVGWVTDLSVENIKKHIFIAHQAQQQRAKIRENAPKLISRDFESKNLIEKYITLYQNVQNGKL